MNRCHFVKQLSSYIDNQLSEREKSRIEEHLKECKICREGLAHLQALSERLKSWQAPVLGEGFDASVRNKIVAQELERGEVKMKKKTLAILVPSGVLAGILVFVLVGVLMRAGFYAGRGQIGTGAVYDEKPSRSYGLAKFEPGRLHKGVGAKGVEHYDLEQVEIAGANYPTQGKGIGGAGVLEGGVPRGFPSETPSSYPAPQPGEGPVIVIQPSLPATGAGDMIIRTATVALEVEDGKDTYNKASQICQELGGYLASSNFYKDKEGREAGTITMRIPKEKFTTALERLSALGKVENIGSNSQDVKQQYANLKAQLDAAMVVYNKMIEALQKRQVTIPEAIRLESELTPVLQKIEYLKNQMEYLNNAVSFTTVTVNFHEPRVSAKTLKDSGRFIQESLISSTVNAVKVLAAAIPILILVVVCGAVLTGLAVLVYWIIRLFKRG